MDMVWKNRAFWQGHFNKANRILTRNRHRRPRKFIRLMHRTFDSLPLAVVGIPDIL
jgi:hypothetical protein